ncbi:Uncharacterised protein [Achromobacter sp. 2789STDY5608621]|nr:Uncharacterised protein [Achromobacter sp. 2789STDY5608621]
MKVTLAIWMAMACAASSASPSQPIRKAAALKMVTSKAVATPIGRPSFQNAFRRGQSGCSRSPNRR